jgi:hypothetical protein
MKSIGNEKTLLAAPAGSLERPIWASPVPMRCPQVLLEWQRDWTRFEAYNVLREHAT